MLRALLWRSLLAPPPQTSFLSSFRDFFQIFDAPQPQLSLAALGPDSGEKFSFFVLFSRLKELAQERDDIDSLLQDPFMLMGPVPKKKISHSRKRKRMQTKWIYEQVSDF